MATPHTPQKRGISQTTPQTIPVPATPPTSPPQRLQPAIPNSAQEAWNKRETQRRINLFSLSRPSSTVRISHGLSTGLLVQEDFVLRHQEQMSAGAIAQQQPPSIATWGYVNPQGIVLAKGVFRDKEGKEFPYELEVVFARDILRTSWEYIGCQEGRLSKPRIMGDVAKKYVGIKKEDTVFVYDLFKQHEREERKRRQAEQEAERAEARGDYTSVAAASAGKRMQTYLEQALVCVQARAMEERLTAMEVAHGRSEQQEFETVLNEWDAFSREVKARAKQLGRAQFGRVRKPLPRTGPIR